MSLDPYRRASLKILEIFRTYCDRVEKASVDESFLDMSTLVKKKLLEQYPELRIPPPDNDSSCALPLPPSITYSEVYGVIIPLSEDENEEGPMDWDDVIMCLAAEMIRNIRKEVEETLNYTCSAGIARNKMLAKLAAGANKPNQQVPFLMGFDLPETILRNRAVEDFLKDIPFTKIRTFLCFSKPYGRESWWKVWG